MQSEPSAQLGGGNSALVCGDMTPAAALKFMVDGQESQNLLLQNSFLSSGSWNFFEKPLANRVKPFDPVENPT